MTQARALAEDALRGYLSDPLRARQAASEAYRLSSAQRDWVTASLSSRVLGLVAGHLSDSESAHRQLSTAVRLGLRGQDPCTAARARTDLAYVLMRQGHSRAALRELDKARPHLGGDSFGELLMMEALVFQALGRWEPALEAYRKALPLVQSSGDRQALAMLLGNRGVLQLYRSRSELAERDLLEADALLESLGQDLHRAITLHNLGCVSALRGEVQTALARFEQAELGYARHRQVPLELWRDRCELLLAAGLGAEARTAAEQAIQAATTRSEPAELAEARLRLAQAALVDGDPETARLLAEESHRAFARQRRPGWAALARWIALEARLISDAPGVDDAHLRRAAAQLDKAGWNASALEARLQAGRRALERGHPRRGVADLQRVRQARSAGPLWDRQLGWHGEALLRQQRGDSKGALRAAARGLSLVEHHRATLGATDLRAAASRRVAALADLGLRLALQSGRPATVLQWAERTRAAALLRPPVRASGDSQVVADLAELRQVMGQRKTAVVSGSPDRELLRRQVALETAIRQRTRLTEGTGAATPITARVGELAGQLGDAALVEYVRCGDQLLALTLAGGRLRLSELGPVEPVMQEMHFAFFALRRMAAKTATSPGSARRTLKLAAQRLDDALLQPLLRVLGDRNLVIVPTAPLHAMPWSVLPSCHGRPVSVSPSAATWLKAVSNPTPPGNPIRRPVLVSGPHLAHAEPEVDALARLHAPAQVLRAGDATVAAVLEAMDGANLVHIAAHGQFRSDNPQFSAVDLVDGPLTVYDIERLHVSPRQVVLSACETGRSTVLVGDELLGLASALLTLGARSLIAPVLQVPDAETRPLMLDLHRGLRRGEPASQALAGAAERARELGDAAASAAASFVCLGS